MQLHQHLILPLMRQLDRIKLPIDLQMIAQEGSSELEAQLKFYDFKKIGIKTQHVLYLFLKIRTSDTTFLCVK